VILVDKTTGINSDLKSTPDVSFTASSGATPDRFVLRVGTITTSLEDPLVSPEDFSIYNAYGFINIETRSEKWNAQKGSISIYDMTGRSISNLQNTEFNKNSIVQVGEPGTKGIYMVEIRSGLKRYVAKVAVK
jgi:hypothetical protein